MPRPSLTPTATPKTVPSFIKTYPKPTCPLSCFHPISHNLVKTLGYTFRSPRRPMHFSTGVYTPRHSRTASHMAIQLAGSV